MAGKVDIFNVKKYCLGSKHFKLMKQITGDLKNNCDFLQFIIFATGGR